MPCARASSSSRRAPGTIRSIRLIPERCACTATRTSSPSIAAPRNSHRAAPDSTRWWKSSAGRGRCRRSGRTIRRRRRSGRGSRRLDVSPGVGSVVEWRRRPGGEHLVNLLDEALGSERLEDDRCAELQPVLHFGELPLALDDSEARHVENAEIRPLQPEQQRQILAARAGHHDGGHQEVDRAVMRRGNAHRLLGVERVQDLVALLSEHFAGRGKDIGLVVHQQNSFHKWPPTAAIARIAPAYQDSTGRCESLTPLDPCLSFRLLPWSRAEASSHAICRETSPAPSPTSSTPPAKPSPTTSCQWCSTAARRRARFVPPPTST